jgi:hypothetical protein
MRLTITAAQRDALYSQILDRLSGIGDIELAIRLEQYETAEQLGREYSDDLRLLLDDLGFGDGSGDRVGLTTPPEVLARTLPRLRRLAEDYNAGLDPEWDEIRHLSARNRLIIEACATVLAGLNGTASGRG